MILPKEAELLGAAIDLRAGSEAGFETVLRLEPEPHRDLIDALAKEPVGLRIYLLLEHIQGTHDATALNVYLDLPAGAQPGEHRDLQAGSVGLYGLRRASIPQGLEGGPGLSFVLDVTSVFLGLPVARSPTADALRVSILPHRKLAEPKDITIGRIAVFWQRHSA